MPGPSHVLKMGKELSLATEQEERVRKVFDDMRREAAAEWMRYVSLEEGLEEKFRHRHVTATELLTLLATIEESRARLRFVHLSAHLMLLDILTQPQIDTYNRLRGYKCPDNGRPSETGTAVVPCQRLAYDTGYPAFSIAWPIRAGSSVVSTVAFLDARSTVATAAGSAALMAFSTVPLQWPQVMFWISNSYILMSPFDVLP